MRYSASTISNRQAAARAYLGFNISMHYLFGFMLRKCAVMKSDPSAHESRRLIAGLHTIVDHIGLDISYQQREAVGIVYGPRDSDKKRGS